MNPPTQYSLVLPDTTKMANHSRHRDTIFDRTKLLNAAKEKKPWNRTLAEKERIKQ